MDRSRCNFDSFLPPPFLLITSSPIFSSRRYLERPRRHDAAAKSITRDEHSVSRNLSGSEVLGEVSREKGKQWLATENEKLTTA